MFRTEITIPESNAKISHQTPILTIGSCFSDCMGSKFVENKFDVSSNPFGTVYNPVSIANLLQYARSKGTPSKETYTETQGLHANFDFHSSFSHPEKETVQQRVKLAVEQTSNYLKKANWLIVTLGTAFVYERIDTGQIVANCHKLPAILFNKRLLSERQVTAALEPVFSTITSENTSLQIILTVSPVRHLKDTLEHNMLSKSILRAACSTLNENISNLHYFPSYEIMMDDLRDYRFYKSDMIHPSDEAENYIWEKFSSAYFDKRTQALITAWSKIRAALNHKPFNPTSAEHQKFINKTIDQLRQLEKQLDVSNELAELERKLVK